MKTQNIHANNKKISDISYKFSKISKPFNTFPAILIAISFLNAQYTHAQFDNSLADKLQSALNQSLKTNNIIGASAAVYFSDSQFWLGTSGYSIPVTRDTVRSDMLFSIGSITKTYTAAMMLKLADSGILSLNDALHQWIPNYKNIDSSITIKQLLQHTSGLFNITDHPDFMSVITGNPQRVWTPEEILANLVDPPVFSKGASWGYSNTNFIIAGMIIKAASGRNISTELHTKFLDPKQLYKTFLEVEDTLKGELVHYWVDTDGDGHLEDLHSISRQSRYSCAWSAGAIISTAKEVAKWANLLYKGEFFGKTYLDEMLSFHPEGNYGLGSGRFSHRGYTLWGHGGAIFGFNSVMVYLPEDAMSLVVLLNQNEYADAVAFSLLDAYFDYRSASVGGSVSPELDVFLLPQNYSNLFDSRATIRYILKKSSNITLKIYSINGKEIITLVNGFNRAGEYEIQWHPKDLPGGIYLCKLQSHNISKTVKFIL